MKATNMFNSLMKQTDKLSDTVFKATTAKRQTVIVPEGITIYDTDEKTFYAGDGVTYGGISSTRKLVVRKVPIYSTAATSGVAGVISGNTTTKKLYWSGVGRNLRTGDSVVIASGGGAGEIPPSGIAASGGTYWVVKDKDDLFSDSFKVCTTQSGAFSGTPSTINVSGSGVAGWNMVIGSLQVGQFEDVLDLNPVSGSATVLLPYPGTVVSGLVSGSTAVGTSSGRKITIRRSANATNTGVIGVSGANASGLASGVKIDDVAASGIAMTSGAAGTTIAITLVSDTGVNGYFSIAETNGTL